MYLPTIKTEYHFCAAAERSAFLLSVLLCLLAVGEEIHEA